MSHTVIKNEKGAGIILVLVVMSLVGAAAVYLMDLNKVSEKKIVGDARVASYNSLVTIVTNKLHTGNNCTLALNGLNLGSTAAGGAFHYLGRSISLNLNLQVNPAVLQKPIGANSWFIAGGTSIKDVRIFIEEKVRAPVRLDINAAPIYVAAKGYILILPNHPGVGIKLERNKHYKIPIFVYYQRSGGGNIVRGCFDPTGDAAFCTSTGGAYNSITSGLPQDQRCQPDRTCFAYKSGIVNSPSGCPSPYSTKLIGYTPSMGNLYLCEWCNRNSLMVEEAAPGFFFNYPVDVNHPVLRAPILAP